VTSYDATGKKFEKLTARTLHAWFAGQRRSDSLGMTLRHFCGLRGTPRSGATSPFDMALQRGDVMYDDSQVKCFPATINGGTLESMRVLDLDTYLGRHSSAIVVPTMVAAEVVV
jgi:hypothetical protein